MISNIFILKFLTYYCNVCYETIKLTPKSNYLKSVSHKEIDKCKYYLLSFKNPDINKIEYVYHSYFFEHIKKYDDYLIKFHFKLLFNNSSDFSPYISSNFYKYKFMVFWRSFLDNNNIDFDKRGKLSITQPN